MRIALLCGCLLASWCAAGCDGAASADAPTAGPEGTLVDIARLEPRETWSVAARPTLSLGGPAGPRETQFGRIAGLARLSDGTLVVADAGASVLRYFDSRGRPVRSVGRRGSGPGEFEQLAGVWRFGGDSVATWDLRQQRLTMFSPDGSLLGTVRPRAVAAGAFAPAYGVYPDGSFLLGSGLDMGRIFAEGSRRFRDSVLLVRYGPDGTVLDTVGRFAGDERDADVAGTGFQLNPVPFGRRTFVSVHGAGTYVLAGEGQITVVGEGGTRSSLLRHVAAPPPVTAEDVEDYRRSMIESASAGERPLVESCMGAVKFPSRMAPYSAMKIDSTGMVWVRLQGVTDRRSSEWAVFSPRGEFLTRLALPAEFVPHQISPPGVLGVRRGALDEEYVEFYPLSRR